MATAFTCTTPDEGWELYSHFLGNLLKVIGANSQIPEDEDEIQQEKRERIIREARAKLVGNLYVIMRRMASQGYPEDSAKMRQIVDMVIEQDPAQAEVRARIHALHKELDLRVGKFEEMLAKLRAGEIPEK